MSVSGERMSRSANHFARTMTMKTFANSLGWNLNPAIEYQRVAPRVDWPPSSTTARSPSVAR